MIRSFYPSGSTLAASAPQSASTAQEVAAPEAMSSLSVLPLQTRVITYSYSYDALGCMTIRNTTPYTYNGDGALVQGGATRYTQDLAAPMTQILQTPRAAPRPTICMVSIGLRLSRVAPGHGIWPMRWAACA